MAGLWARVLGTAASGRTADFFADGGGSLAAAQLVSALRERFPQVTVADVYEYPLLGPAGRPARRAGARSMSPPGRRRSVRPLPARAQLVQQLVTTALAFVIGARWLVWVCGAAHLLRDVGGPALAAARRRGGGSALGWLLLISPAGRIGLSVGSARLLLRGVRPGKYPRGGSLHLRLWATEAAVDAFGATNLSCAPFIPYYARALGAKIGRGVDLHAIPPVTGLLTLGRGASVEPEVDLSGYWLDGDVLRVGRVRVGSGRQRRARAASCCPGPGSVRTPRSTAGSAISGLGAAGRAAGAGRRACGSVSPTATGRGAGRPARSRWVPVYAATAAACSPACRSSPRPPASPSCCRSCSPPTAAWATAVGTVLALALPGHRRRPRSCTPVLTWLIVRLLGVGLREGHHPVRSRLGWQIWATERLMDDARTYLYPLYASLLTPVWMRLLGADVGTGVEASTVLMLPRMTTVGDDAFLADDTLVGSYELSGGWMRIEPAKIGKRSFLGNSGMTGPGRVVPQEQPGRRAVGGPGGRQGRHVLAGQPAGRAAPQRGDRRREPDLRPGHGA